MSYASSIVTFFLHPARLCLAVAAIALAALVAAFVAEAFFELEPCRLCIYQRYPYAAVLILGLAGFVMRRRIKACAIFLLLCGVSFLTNAAIAAYHTGVERHWWASAVDSCAITFVDKHSSMLENILSAPMGRCDEIPWQDPILGLSMANYNIGLCLFLFCVCAVVGIKAFRKRQEPTAQS